MKATVFPGQPHLPVPNTRSVCFFMMLLVFSSASIQRSGLKMLESAPKTDTSWATAQVLCPILVPGGMNWPLNVSPSGPTCFMMRPPKGGCTLRPS